jgi:hypothetical protein
MTWVVCRNQQCLAEYQITKMKYFKWVEKHDDPRIPEAPALICEKCNARSVHVATKCEKCQLIFEPGSVLEDIEDRCPQCGYSKKEELRRIP